MIQKIKKIFSEEFGEWLAGILLLVIEPLIIIIPILLLGCVAWSIVNWHISLPIIMTILAAVWGISKANEFYKRDKWKKISEKERMAACEFCKNHPELIRPIRHQIISFSQYIMYIQWQKYGKGVVIVNDENQPCVIIYNILKEAPSANGFPGYYLKTIESYRFPIFETSTFFEIGCLVNLEESNIILITTEDRRQHIYIYPKIISKEETNSILQSLYKQAHELCEGEDKGEKSQKDSNKAFLLFREAAQLGYVEAECCLGCCYRNGYGTQVDYKKAKYWYDKSSNNGCTRAIRHIARSYEEGQGVSQSYEKAMECYKKAAEQNDAEAQCRLGCFYEDGQGASQNYEKAVEWYEKAAEQGHARAQFCLGYCYFRGNGVSQNYEKAVEWYKMASEQGNNVAQNFLGHCYEKGLGVPQSYEKAVEWYEMASEQGNKVAQCFLGQCYEKGLGVPQNYEKAVEWYTKAAMHGVPYAQYLLGCCLENGHGTPQNHKEAMHWYSKAADKGQMSAKRRLEELGKIVNSVDMHDRTSQVKFKWLGSIDLSLIGNPFSEEQLSVINIDAGCHIVLAPPGCGKTRVLAERVVYAIKKNVNVEDMLCLTFTNRAAREMKERILNRAGNETFDSLFVGNVHHFCSYILREYKVISQRTTIIDDEEKTAVLQGIIRHLIGKELKDLESYYYYQHYLYQVEHNHPAELIVQSEFGDKFWEAEYKEIAREYVSYKERYDLLDFEDLLLKGYDFIRNNQEVIKKYSWIQIDEVQDLNSLQIAIIDLVADDNACIVYLGDEQQAIYAFNGAKLITLELLKNKCKGNIHHFHGNYRSPQYLLDVLNKYAEVNLHVSSELLPIAKGKDAQSMKEEGCLVLETCEKKEGRNAADYCSYDLACDRSISYQEGRTAILVSSNKEVDLISERLFRRGIEHFKISGSDFMWSKEIKLILAHFNVFIHPENIMSWARILLGLKIMPSLERAHAFISNANDAFLYGNDLLNNNRRSLIKDFIRYYPNELVIFDTETTGLDVNNDDIVEIAALRIKDGCIVDELDVILETTRSIPVELDGEPNPLIEEYKKRDKIRRNDGLIDFLSWVGDVPVLAHNAKYDFQILDTNLRRDCGINNLSSRWPIVLDSLKIVKAVEPDLNSYRLKDLLATFGLSGKNSHLAIDDIKATKNLVDYCYQKANPIFVKQNAFFANNREVIKNLRKLYSDLYRHTEKLLSEKGKNGQNVFVTELDYIYNKFVEAEFIDKLDKMRFLELFLTKDFIKDASELTLLQILEKYLADLITLREADLCDSKSLRERVNLFVSTVHRSKGLEFDNVVVSGAVDGIYPYWETTKVFKESLDLKERRKAQQDIEESARKLYVALSRAKKRLCVQYPQRNTGFGKFGWFDHPAYRSPFLNCIANMFEDKQQS